MERVAVAAHKKGKCSAIKSPVIGGDNTSAESVATGEKFWQMRHVSQLRRHTAERPPQADTVPRSGAFVVVSQSRQWPATDPATDQLRFPGEKAGTRKREGIR